MPDDTSLNTDAPEQTLTGSLERNRRILVIDDNRAIHDDFREILIPRPADRLERLEEELFGHVLPRPAAYEIDSAYQGEDGYRRVCESVRAGSPYALAFVDMRMPPGWDGMKTIEKIWDIDPDLQIVICTAYSDYSWSDITDRFGSTDRLLMLKKPFDAAEVCQLALALTEKWHLARHARLKLSQLGSMVDERTQELTSANRLLAEEVKKRRHSQAALEKSEQRYALAAAGANDGLWDWEAEGNAIYLSPRWWAMTGREPTEALATGPSWFPLVHPDDRPAARLAFAAHMEGDTPHLECEYRLLHADGHYRWMLLRGLAVRDDTGVVRRMAGSQTDITDRKRAEEQLRFDSHHDSLTGLPSRALLHERLERAMLRARRTPTQRTALLFLDLDGFKRINDTLGHQAGDELLVAVATRLVACLRAVDTLASDREHSVTRLGGDEFVVLLEDVRTPADALRIGQRLIDAMLEPFIVDGTEIAVTFSIGLAMAEGPRPADELLRDADTALYQAKDAGKNQIVVFDPSMHEKATARWNLESDLRRAIDRKELRLHYQPIVRLESGQLAGFEALVRWQHPQRGLVPPDEFVPVAEECGLIVPLGRWVLREATRQFAEWSRDFALPPECSVSVNVSARQLAPTLAREVQEVLAATQLPPAALKLELTESAVMENTDAAIAVLDELRAMGIRIHLDDFGTGYSSLSRLHRMPIESLKVDRSFVNTMLKDPMSAAIANMIIVLAQTLGIQVVAEGVETVDELARLTALRCDLAQGYYFSRPVEPAAVAGLFERMQIVREQHSRAG